MKKRCMQFFALLIGVVMLFSISGVKAKAYDTVSDPGFASLYDKNGTILKKTSSGDSDITNAVVDSIAIKSSNGNDLSFVYVWNTFQLVINFSEDDASGNQKTGVDIENGDTIKITWNLPENTYLKADVTSVPLYQDGDPSKALLGTATYTTDSSDHAISLDMTFNENVTSLQHVKGEVILSLTITENGFTEADTAKIIAGDITKEFTIRPSESTGVIGFGTKNGSYIATNSTDGSTGSFQWNIYVNLEKKQLADNTTVTIVDTLPSTESDPTFYVYAYYTDDYVWDYKAWNLSDFQSNYHGTFTVSGQTITITLPSSEVSGKTVILSLYTTTSQAPKGSVTNTVDITHYEYDSPTVPVTDTYTTTKVVPENDASVTGVPKGTIQIHKVVKGTASPIPGVHFKIYKLSDAQDTSVEEGWYNGADYAEVVTGTDGIATLENLTDGKYLIQETTEDLPNWIAESSLPDSQIVTLGGTAGTSVNIENEVRTTNITANKYWYENDGTTLDTSDHPAIYFMLYRTVEGGEPQAVSDTLSEVVTASGEGSASVTWKDLPAYDNTGKAYTYSVREVDAEGSESVPDGYTAVENGLTVNNIKKIPYISVTATKNWLQADGTEDTSEHPDIYLQLYVSTEDSTPAAVENQDIVLVQTPEGRSSSTVTWDNLPQTDPSGNPYTYTVKEVDADGNELTPYGYTCEVSGHIVTNTRQEGQREVPASLKITKTDQAGNALSGAVFTLYSGTEEVMTFSAGTAEISSEDLKALLGDDDSIDLMLKETTAPDGYEADSATYTITLSKSSAKQWEGQADSRRYMTVTTYELVCEEAQDGVLTVVNAPVPKTPETPNTTVNTGDPGTTVLYIVCAAAAALLLGLLLKNRHEARQD